MQILEAARASDEQLQRLGDGTIGLGARILLLALDYDTRIARGEDGSIAIQTILAKESRYGRSLIEKFAACVGTAAGTREILKIPLHKVQPGMTIMQDVRTHLGTLLIARGFEVSPPFLERLRNLGASILSEEVSVLAPQTRANT